jgi:hypothetical protein
MAAIQLPTPSWARDHHGETEVYTKEDLLAAMASEREACALAVEAEHVGADVCDDCDNEADDTYNMALRHGAAAVRARAEAQVFVTGVR